MLEPKDQLVRAGQFDKALQLFYDEVGQRSAELLKNYHKLMVEPLALRVAYLEMPFWRRWYIGVRANVELVRAWWNTRSSVAAPEPEPQTAQDPAGAQPQGDRGSEGPAEPHA